jgi:predicted murein hydrolase (TIGR00659 family)
MEMEIKTMMKEFLIDSVFFGAVLSLAAYEAGALLKRRFKLALFNPLLIATAAVMLTLTFMKIEYSRYHESAKYISYLLTPATVCLAVPLYQQMELLKKNLKAVAGGITAGVLASLASVFLLAKLFSLNHEQYVTLLPKSITTAIGMGVSEELGGIQTITVAVIIITGIFGNVTAEFICKIFRICDPVAKGLAIGTASHAIGTAKAMEMGEIEGAMSSLAIAVAGLMTVLGASVFAVLI